MAISRVEISRRRKTSGDGAPGAGGDGREPALTPLERLERLCDPRTLRLVNTGVAPARPDAPPHAGDGVLAGTGRVEGRPVFCYAQDGRYAGGSVGERHAEVVVALLRRARKAGAPVVAFVESAGARIQDGLAALVGYGRIFRESVALSSVAPQISVISGTAAGGGSYAPALTDFVVMCDDARMFLTGPRVVRQAVGEQVTPEELGGRAIHERNGVCQLVAPSQELAVARVRELLSYLPANAGEEPAPREARAPAGDDPGAAVPAESRRAYDVRRVLDGIVDGGDLLEISPRWARNMVTGFARIDGRVAGIVANQPRYLGGLLDAEASQKAARFVRRCDAFRLPLVVLVDTPGFLPGRRQEGAAVIRHGADLVRAFCEASVPRVTLILRKAYGGAYIAMNSKGLGADLTFAWPSAEIGIMAARQAVAIAHRGDLAAGGELEASARDYTLRHLRPEGAARRGFVDEVIEPAQSRDAVASALATSAPGRRFDRPGGGW